MRKKRMVHPRNMSCAKKNHTHIVACGDADNLTGHTGPLFHDLDAEFQLSACIGRG